MTAPYPATALEPEVTSPLILALPKGRILAECGALLARAGVAPAPDYADEESRRLRFPTDDPALDVVRVRPFDVATFVAFGDDQLGICGADVLREFDYPEIFARSTSASAASRSPNRPKQRAPTIPPAGHASVAIAQAATSGTTNDKFQSTVYQEQYSPKLPVRLRRGRRSRLTKTLHQ